MARILLTGATGFIGAAVLRRALDSGHAVAVLARPGRSPADVSDVTVLHGDLSSPPWETIARFRPEKLVHAAWISTPGVYLDSPENELHVGWALGLVRGLIPFGLRHVVALGTCVEYRTGGGPCGEDRTPLEPASPYAQAKVRLHGMLRQELAGTGIGLAWARVFYPYGEREHPARLCSSIIARFRRQEPAELRTPDSRKDYIHVDDVAHAVMTLAETSYVGAVNLGTGQGVAVRGIAERIADLMGCRPLLRLPTEPRPDPVGDVVADAGRLRSLGWEPKVTLESGLRRLIEHASR